jgi:hypothetical protein
MKGEASPQYGLLRKRKVSLCVAYKLRYFPWYWQRPASLNRAVAAVHTVAAVMHPVAAAHE